MSAASPPRLSCLARAEPFATRRFGRLAALTLGLVAAVNAAQAQAAAPLAPCRIPGVAHEVRCGSVQRPLDAARPKGPAIEVHYAVLPAVARRKLPDAVFLLAGGPGQSAIDLMPQVLPLFHRLNQRRDVVFVDQRGTGRSAPLRCEPQDKAQSSLAAWAKGSGPASALAEAEACLKALNALPWVTHPDDIAQFTTVQAMQDLDAVRRQLDLQQINLVAASYGTRAALDYQRQFPGAVRRLVLDGVAPPDMALHRSSSVDAQAALDAVWAACGLEPACRRRHGDLRATWAALLTGLPRDVEVADPRTGRREGVTLTADMLLAAVRAPLYAPALAAGLPQAVSEAAQGRFEGIAGLFSAVSPRHGPPVYMGMHFSVVCAEDVRRAAAPGSGSPPPQGGAGAGDDDAAARRYEAVCGAWPHAAAVPEAFYRVGPGSAPALLLSGGADPVTPPRHGARVQQALGAAARHVVVPNAGHGVLSLGCVPDLVFRFIDAADAAQAGQVDARCTQNLPRPFSFAPPDAAAESLSRTVTP
jgi:pimeloyl-ACP methyl ester carboxylesterase